MLADGAVHSGTDLAQRLKVSRTAIWKQLQQLQAVELAVEATPGQGYRLMRRLELLDRAQIHAGLSPVARDAVESLDIHAVIDSTNEALRGQATMPGCVRLVLAEYQTGGRGRRGRRWLSPFAGGLCLSASWHFPEMPSTLPALSLAIGVAACRALSHFAPVGLGLKWPNDIVAGDAKLGGMLIDVQGETGGPLSVIVGVGINIEAIEQVREQIVADGNGSLPPVGLVSLVTGDAPSRNRVAAVLINELVATLGRFQADGFAAFANEWRSHDCMAGRLVTLQAGNQVITGRAAGIDDNGALLIDDGDTVRSFVSGEVTLRAVGGA